MREDIYNNVIQEYSEVQYFDCSEDSKMNIIDNIVDLIENYGDDVYKVITLLDYDINHLLDYEYLETQMINYINDYK
tara:strand:+ start:112 stop:342 length:231 start_codon:yes stop_codon:yes gene_type:complete